jgi:tRNA uridine 5-carboxymethylaminomethyl modification enzyme
MNHCPKKLFKKFEAKSIPGTFDFSSVPSLRLEARQKFAKIRPTTIGQAARISGVSPADISILMVWLKRWAGTNGQDDSLIEIKATDSGNAELEE